MGICSQVEKPQTPRNKQEGGTRTFSQTTEKTQNNNNPLFPQKEKPIKIYNRLSEKTKFDDVNQE